MGEPTAKLEGSTLILDGDWVMGNPTPELPQLDKISAIKLGALDNWDSTLAAKLWTLERQAQAQDRPLEIQNAPENLRKLMALALGKRAAPRHGRHAPLSYRLKAALWLEKSWEAFRDALNFLGQIIFAIGAFTHKKAHYRQDDWMAEFYEAGYKALPIIILISFLVGLIVAFVSAIQLKLFGAAIYVADLVGLSMTREMGALMSAILMAGRTGAAYAAQIGSMKRSEELDALRTMGLSPIEMVVVPRLVALTLMLPLLSIVAVFVGMFGGMLITNSFFDVSVFQYLNQTSMAVGPKEFFIGVIKAFVYGFLVAFAGAWRGVRCGSSADDVGRAATSAVVLGITLVIIANAIFAVTLNALHL